MTAKEMYRKACWIAQEIEIHQHILEKLSDIVDPRIRPDINGFSQGARNRRASDPVGKHILLFEKEFEAQRETKRILTELSAEQRNISAAVQEIPHHDYRVILFGRYVQLKQWNDIIITSGYKKSRVMELHKEAFNYFIGILRRVDKSGQERNNKDLKAV